MIKLVWIGPNQANNGGHSSKAYTIRRRGRAVSCRWGPVECRGGGGGCISWLGNGPQERVETFTSTKEATDFVAKLKAEKIANGYRQLPWHKPIS